MLKKAVVLAAGKGARMKSLTADIPKPMLPLKGKPILEHILERLQACGIEEAFLVIGYLGEVIERHFAHYPMRIHFRHQETLDGTARAALLAREFVGQDPFFLTYGDNLVDESDYRGLLARLDGDVSAVLGVKHVDDPWQGAAVYEDGGVVSRIVEKPPAGTSTTNWNSAGMYAFTAPFMDELARVDKSARGEYELTTGVEQLLAARKKVLIYPIVGVWRDIGRPEDLEAAQKMV